MVSAVVATAMLSAVAFFGATGDGKSFWETRITTAARASAMRRRFSMNYERITAQDRSRRYRMAGIELGDEWSKQLL
jgi:hypothetical protein